MLQDFLQVDLLGAGVRKRCAPPFVHMPPPPGCTPPPLTHPPPLPAPGSTPDPSASFSHPCSARAQHSSPGLRLALFAHPSRLHRLLPGLHRPSFCAPSPRARSPCVRSSTDAWPLARGPPLPHALLARGTLCAALPLCAPPSLLHFRHARKRACGRGGAPKRRGKRCGPGGADRREREGGTPSLVPPRHACKGGGGRVGEVRRGEARRGTGGGLARAEGRTEGWVRTVPPVPPPAFEQRGGEGAH